MGHGIKEFDRGFLTDDAWHRHSNYTVTGQPLTLEQVHEVFSFEVLPQPVYIEHAGDMHEVENKRALVRQDIGLPLSIMSGSYVNHDYRSFFGRLWVALAGEGVKVVSIGTLSNGGAAFMSAEIPSEFGDTDFPGWSATQQVLNFGDSVDGTSTNRAGQAMRAIVCRNTFQANLLGVPALWRIPHRKNAREAVSSAIETLGKAIDQTKAIRDAVEQLCNDPFTEADFAALLTHPTMLGEVSANDSQTKITRHANRFESIVTRYHGADVDGIRETKMGALMALQGWEQHVAQVNKGADRTSRNIGNVVFGEKTSPLAAAASAILVGAN